ncbi:hypothetical protein [Castellaniella sp. MT123]|uniref:hypothetical protein n=1 Tax=Castellaniella sp. MT123 TaxID=3140381 RepID=UPI0031F3FA70
MRQALQMSLRATLLAAGLGCTVLFMPAAQAAAPQTQYQRDVEHCNSTPGIDKKACLHEAGAAAQAARQDALTSPPTQTEDKNRTLRCNGLPAGQREDCMKLMESANTREQGSVQSGGILRETTITIPATTGS